MRLLVGPWERENLQTIQLCEFSSGDRRHRQDLQGPAAAAKQVPKQQGQGFVHVRQAGVVVVPVAMVPLPLQDQRYGARWCEMVPDFGAAGTGWVRSRDFFFLSWYYTRIRIKGFYDVLAGQYYTTYIAVTKCSL